MSLEPVGDPVKRLQGDLKRFLAFSLGQEQFAIPLLAVKEVIAKPDYTPIPHTPSHFLGIINLRGQVISVVDLRTKFGIKADPTAESAVIICDLHPLSIGVVVNSVNSVLSLTDDKISPPPEVESSKKTDHFMGVARHDNRLVLLLDIARALGVEDLRLAQAAGEKAHG